MIRKFHFTKRSLGMRQKLVHTFDHKMLLYKEITSYSLGVSVILELETENSSSDFFRKTSSRNKIQ